MGRLCFIASFVFVALLFSTTPLSAQDTSACEEEEFRQSIDRVIAEYSALESGTTVEQALSEASSLTDKLNRAIDRCTVLISESSASDEPIGDGSIENPYGYGQLVDSGEGFNIQISRYIRPGDNVIRNENRFNDRPAADEVYIILGLEISCQPTETRCQTNYFDYEMVGDLGIIYEYESVVYDNKLDINVLGDSSGTGDLVFLVKKNDTNLRLLYDENSFDDAYVALLAEPSAGDGLEVTATSNLNVRTGPGTNFGIAGSLQAGIATIAFGRNEDGSWVQTGEGWLFTDLLTFSGDVMVLPVATE